MIFKHLLTFAAALALCAACAESLDPGNALDKPQPLVFSAAQGDLTLSTRAAADGTWEGDGTEYVAIQVGDEVKKYKVTSSDGALEPADGETPFYRSNTEDIEVTAWYPYSASKPTALSIATDQSSKEGREASNLMTASATAKFGETTKLSFSHQTALIKVSITGEDGTAVTGATVTILGIKAYENGNGSYSALFPPATVNSGANFISITKDSKTYKSSAPSNVTLEKGKSYGYNFNLKRSLVTTGGIEVTLSGTELEYTGSTVRPTVTVTYNGEKLTEDTHYTLSWSNESSSAKGTYTVSVNGKGAYIGSVEKSYSIVEAPPYLTFTASGAQTFTMTLQTNTTAAAAIGTFEYSVGGGEWTKVTSGMDAVSFGGGKGNLRLRGTGLNSAGGESLLGTAYHGGYYSTISFGTSASVAASGDIRTLINGKGYATVSTSKAKFCYLFSGCTVLTSAPELPATDLASQCYQGLFSGCTNLTTAPVLNATTLASNCYYSMFSGCTNLKNGPSSLPAKSLASQCYTSMFSGCEALETAPTISAESLADQCCQWMFSGCTSLTAAPALQAKTLAEYCYQWMFQKCTNLTSAPELPAESLATQCYYGMFSGCTALTTAPDLPATKLVYYCYYQMFSGCTNLESVTIKATTSSNDYALEDWLPVFEASSPTRTIYYSDDATAKLLSELSAIPTGWECKKYELKSFYVEAAETVTGGIKVNMTSNSGPTINLLYSTDGTNWEDFTVGSTEVTLSKAGDKVWFKAGKKGDESIKTNTRLATGSSNYNKFSFTGKVNVGGDITSLLSADGAVSNLSSYGTYTFRNLFNGNTGLISAENLSLPSTTLASDCYAYMFGGCTNLTSAPELPATTLASFCYNGMFIGCSNLTSAPELNAAELKISCYAYMFSGCTSLKSVTIKATTVNTSSLYDWLPTRSDNAGTIYYSDDATKTLLTNASAIPTGWTVSQLTN